MSLLSVDKLGHSFGDRTLFKDVSFRSISWRTCWFSWSKWRWKIDDDEYYYKSTDSRYRSR